MTDRTPSSASASPRSMATYDTVTDRTTVWTWAKAPKLMRDLEGVTHVWKALFWIPGKAAPRA